MAPPEGESHRKTLLFHTSWESRFSSNGNRSRFQKDQPVARPLLWQDHAFAAITELLFLAQSPAMDSHPFVKMRRMAAAPRPLVGLRF